MILHAIKILCLLTVYKRCFADNKNIPEITHLEQLTENSVRIEWIFSSLNYLQRYRVQISNDNFENSIHEWPVQLEKIISDTNGPIIETKNSKSSFDCFNECIRNPFCYTATRNHNSTSEFNCLLKGKYDTHEHMFKTDFIEGFPAASANVEEFEKNEAFIKNLPYDYTWWFRVSIFDQMSGKWSKFSAPSKPLKVGLDLAISLTRTSLTSLQVNWNQNGKFRDYNISRYIVTVTSLDSQQSKVYFDTQNLTSTITEPLYFEPYLPEPIQQCPNELSCYKKCIESSTCVQFVFYKEQQKCHLINSFNPANGVEDSSALIRTIKSNSKGFLLENLEMNTKYDVKVDYITSYGTKGTSNLNSYLLGNFQTVLSIKSDPNVFNLNLNWSVPNKLDIRAYSVQYFTNKSTDMNYYIEKSPIDYEDPNVSSFNATLNNCYESCNMNTSCLAFSWSNNECYFKKDLSQARNCSTGSICSRVKKNRTSASIENLQANTNYCFQIFAHTNFDVTGNKSNEECFQWNVTVFNQPSTSQFTEKESTTLSCILNGVSIAKVQSLEWLKNDQPISSGDTTYINYREMLLNLSNLSHVEHNGNYTCRIKLTNMQELYSNTVNLRVNFKSFLKLNNQKKTIVTSEKMSLNLTCEAEGYPTPDIHWSFNSNNLNSNFIVNKLEYGMKSSLILTNISISDNGTYSCFTDENSKRYFDVLVDLEPQFLTESKNLTVDENQSVEFVCSIVQKQMNKSSLAWRKLNDEKRITQYEEFRVNDRYTSIMKIENVNRKDTGTFECYLEGTPEFSITYNLFIRFQSYLIDANQYYEISVKKHQNIEIECTAVGYPVSIITWKSMSQSNKILQPAKVKEFDFNISSTLILQNVHRSDSGNYSCELPNRNNKKIFRLIVQTVPSKPVITELKSEEDNVLRVFWLVADNGGAALEKMILEWSGNFSLANHTHNMTVLFKNNTMRHRYFVSTFKIPVLPDLAYIRIYVENSIGKSNTSEIRVFANDKLETLTQLSRKTLKIVGISAAVVISVVLLVLIILRRLRKMNFQLKKTHALKIKKFFVEAPTVNTADFTSLSSTDGISTTNHRLAMSYDSSMFENFERKSGSSSCVMSKSLRLNSNTLHHQHARLRTRTQKKKKSRSFSNYPFTNSESDSDSKCYYSVETLIKRFTGDLSTLDRDLHFEFLEIRNFPKNKSFKDSLKLPNERKSRYKHIYPYDDNRVKLELIDDRPDSDFINASYIEGFRTPRKFIAAQGATKTTASDFLRMIVEKNVTIIVMLTQLYEGDPSVLKCFPYWNDIKVLKFGQVTSRVISFENHLSYEKRLIQIKYLEKVITVEHFYYKEWPDKSCPCSAQSILNLIAKINANSSSFETFPVLVHCSAGIGRTGTFIAISNLIEMMIENKRITPKRVVAEMRKQRAFLVQTWEQYKFIHQAVLEWCMFGTTLINIDNRSLCKLKLNDETLLQMEYENIKTLNNKASNLTVNVFSYETILEEDDFQFSSGESEYLETNEPLPVRSVVQLKNFLHPAQVFLIHEPVTDQVNDYFGVIFKLRPTAIVLVSNQNGISFLNSNGKVLPRVRTSEFIILCKENKKIKIAKENNLDVYEIEIINTTNKSTFTTCFIRFKVLPSQDSILDYEIKPLIHFHESLTKIFNSKINSSKDKAPRIVFQNSAQAKEGFEELSVFTGLFFLLQNIFKSREFDVVQTVRLLQCDLCGLFSKFEYYKFLYEICCSDEMFDILTQLKSTSNDEY